MLFKPYDIDTEHELRIKHNNIRYELRQNMKRDIYELRHNQLFAIWYSVFMDMHLYTDFRHYPAKVEGLITEYLKESGDFQSIGAGPFAYSLAKGGWECYYDEGEVLTSRNKLTAEVLEVFPHFEKMRDYLKLARPDFDDPTKMLVWNPRALDRPPRSISAGKYFRKLVTYHKYRFSEQEITEAAESVFTLFSEPNYEFELSTDVYDTYAEKSFGSCMYLEDSVAFFDQQPNVRVLRIIDGDSGDLVGRALVWDVETREGSQSGHATLMDRIYPSDGGRQVDAAIKYAQEQGWEYKTKQSVGGGTTLGARGVAYRAEFVDTGDYPYLDTLHLSARGDKYLYPSGRDAEAFGDGHEVLFGWDSTSGTPPWGDDDDDEHPRDWWGDLEYDHDCDCDYCYDHRIDLAHEEFYDPEEDCNCYDCIVGRARDHGWMI